MTKVRYESMRFHYIISHWDYHQRGTCIYNNKIALFNSVDETDYETMHNTCPYCSDQTKDINLCHCESATELFCIITELPHYKRIYYRLYPYGQLIWYIKNWGIQGIQYWKRWKY